MQVRRRGYSFPEVLFAVVVLGIGFIMIAAIFPVAISQSKLTADETTSAALARSAVTTVSRIAVDDRLNANGSYPDALMPPTGPPTGVAPYTGEVSPLNTRPGWATIRGALIFAEDPRYAFVPLYRRDGDPNTLLRSTWAGTAQLFVVTVIQRGVVAPRTQQEFNAALDTGRAITSSPIPQQGDYLTANPNNLYPHQVLINRITDNYQGSGIDIIEFNPTRAAPQNNAENRPDAVAEGTYVITRQGGRILRVGVARPDVSAAAWELMPGNDVDGTNPVTATAGWVIGRERLANGEFSGPAQDIAVYTTFIPVKP
jgi:hypothetical protein